MNYPANRAKLEFPGKDEESPKFCITNPYLSTLSKIYLG